MSAKETYILGKETYYCISIPEGDNVRDERHDHPLDEQQAPLDRTPNVRHGHDGVDEPGAQVVARGREGRNGSPGEPENS